MGASGVMVPRWAGLMVLCGEWTEEDDGTTTEWTLREISFPDLGRESVAFRMSTVTFLGPLKSELVIVRHSPWFGGDTVIHIAGLSSLGSADNSLEELVRLADDKARRELNLR